MDENVEDCRDKSQQKSAVYWCAKHSLLLLLHVRNIKLGNHPETMARFRPKKTLWLGKDHVFA